MKPVLHTLIAAAVLATAPVYAQDAAESARKPNIIYIFADDLGHADIGAYGQKIIRTPNLDRMAEEGMRFTRHYTSSPVCAPSRCSLLTGLHSGHAVVRGNYELGGFEDDREGGQMPLPPNTRTIGTVLQKEGYATACVGKWGLGMVNNSGHPNRQGFDYFFGYLDQKQAHNYYPTHLWENENSYPLNNEFRNVHTDPDRDNPDFDIYQQGDHAADHMTTKALEFIAKNQDKPFFLYYASPIPHLSLQPKQEFLEPYLEIIEEDPAYVGKEHPRYTPHKTPRAAYAAMVSMLDADVGLIMDKVKELGLEDNTLIMFCSDNGATFDTGGADLKYFKSNGNLRGGKAQLWEGGIREPMLARWPGRIKSGTVTDHPSATYDVLATIAELVDVKIDGVHDGISFLPTLLDKSAEQKKHDFLYWEYPARGGQIALQRGPWKIIRRGVRENRDAPWQLYNLETDESESNNVADQHPELVKEMAEIARQQHWHPIVQDWEFINPMFDE